MLTLTPLLLQLIKLGVAYAPELIDAAIAEVNLVMSGEPVTNEQQAQIDAALELAHTTLQNAIPPPLA